MTHLPINLDDLRALIAAGEDSTLQFKADITNADSLAAEMAAMTNGKGAGASCWALPTTMISWVIKVISRVTLTREIYSAASVRAAENLVDEIEYRSARGDAVRVGHSHAWGK